ncbi:MAG: SET domain-containing protein-lysine N-methyltransferase [bacterium]|nr:SET domain-containing protein-lysine N-methyltransferase [bacterium]
MDNPKVIVKETGKYGKGLFAREKIFKDEIIAEFDGKIYDSSTNWTKELEDHVIQFSKNNWRGSNGIARLINHSCEPNCGIKDLFKIVSMREISPREEVVWDYEMTENHTWRMECKCGHSSCRKIIGAYDNMPQNVRGKYGDYISEWLR